MYESNESSGTVSLKGLFENPKKIKGNNTYTLDDLSYFICRGGWPQLVGNKRDDALKIPFDYLNAIIRSDINRADGVKKNPERVKYLMKSYARNICTQAPNTTLKNDIASHDSYNINEYTVQTYIEALKKIFVVEEMPSWNPNLRSKTAIRTTDTRYFIDPSLGAASLGVGPNDLKNDLNTLGLLFENLCVRDLRTYADAIDGNIYHFRNAKGLECDCVVHLRNGDFGLIEIKLGGDVLIEEAAKNLRKLSNLIDTSKMKKPSFAMILVGVGSFAYRREDGIYVVPISCLKH